MNRTDKHYIPRRRVAARLRRLGLNVRSVPSTRGYDLLVNEEIRLALRVAFPSMRRHRVKVGGRTYQYRYRTWHFNFHHHGKMDERYTDFFVCIGLKPGNAHGEVFVIPWEKASGKTFSLHGGRGRYSGQYAPFRNAWSLVTSAARRTRTLAHVA